MKSSKDFFVYVELSAKKTGKIPGKHPLYITVPSY